MLQLAECQKLSFELWPTAAREKCRRQSPGGL